MKKKLIRIAEHLHIDVHYVARAVRAFVKWVVCSVLTGLIVGALSFLFVKALNFSTEFFAAHHRIIFLLPVAGCLIVFMYGIFHDRDEAGTNLVLAFIHAKEEIPLRMAPMIFIATTLTHLFGASAGREGGSARVWRKYRRCTRKAL